jgi:uncharacterized oligopeptide transporter (OPT) family protein
MRWSVLLLSFTCMLNGELVAVLEAPGVRVTIPSGWNVIVDLKDGLIIGDFPEKNRVKAVISPPGHGHITIVMIAKSKKMEHMNNVSGYLKNSVQSESISRVNSRTVAITTISGINERCIQFNYVDIGKVDSVALITASWYCDDDASGSRVRSAAKAVSLSVEPFARPNSAKD